MPFAGEAAAASEAVRALRSLRTRSGDELILVDNGGVSPDVLVELGGSGPGGPAVVQALAERSPAHARNVGASRARNAWILFIDADTNPRSDLLDAYFAEAVGDDVGGLVGEVVAAPGAQTLVGRYGAARGFLSQRAHLDHPYRPRAAAANLLVRRVAFEALGGFYEGVRAAEDTDFSWRLQQAGWRLELRAGAYVEHRYRTTLGDLRRQWRGYAAGRAWLARRYEGFEPEPGVARGLRRLRGRERLVQSTRGASGTPRAGPVERGAYAALDALLSVEELAGFALSNRPAHHGRERSQAPDVVLVADRFPAQGDPLVELARTLERVRVEALARPESLDIELARGLRVEYLEDDGAADRLIACAYLVVRHPLRAARDLLTRGSGQPRLWELAPAVRRLERDGHARVHALGTGRSAAAAERLARLSGRGIER
jgi:GT2 family glycosyltransferase